MVLRLGLEGGQGCQIYILGKFFSSIFKVLSSPNHWFSWPPRLSSHVKQFLLIT